MRIPLDNCVPRQLRTSFSEHQVDTAGYRGWERVANGALLALAEPEYDILITSDQNLRYQQNLSSRRISLTILPTNNIRVVLSLVREIRQAIAEAKPGSWAEIRQRNL